MAIREEALGARHRNTLNTNANLAAALIMADRAEDAEALARYVVGVEEAIGLDDPVMVASALSTWGRALAAMERFEEAEEQLLAAHELQERELGAEHPRTQRNVQALVELYGAWGRTDEASAWEARSAAR